MKTARWVVFLLLLAGSGSILNAELKYTVRIETHKVAAASPADSIMRELGSVLLEMVVPDGSVELTYMLGDKTARVQWNKALMGLPSGAVLIRLADGVMVVLNPADQTYWKVTLTDWYGLPAGRKPVVTRSSTNEPGTVAGVRAEHSTVQIRIPFPEAMASALVFGTPRELPLSGDVWVTEGFSGYRTPALRTVIGLSTLGFDVVPERGFVMRQLLRGPMFGDLELESRVTSIVEEDLPSTLFEIPAGYKEVPAPRIGG